MCEQDELRAAGNTLLLNVDAAFVEVIGMAHRELDVVRDAIGHLPPQERITKED